MATALRPGPACDDKKVLVLMVTVMSLDNPMTKTSCPPAF